MNNILRDRGNQLANVDYTRVLDKIEERIDELNITCNDEYIDFDNINVFIKNIMGELKNEYGTVLDILGIDKEKKPIHLTLNHRHYGQFAHKIKSLSHKMPAYLNDRIVNIAELQSLKKTRKAEINFGMNYSFDEQVLSRKMMSFNSTTKGEERIRIDEVEIKIDIKEISSQLKVNLCNLIKQECDDEELIDEKIEGIEKGRYQVNELISLLNDESLARIKRTISYLYLQYLLDNAIDKQNQGKKYKLACSYVQRFEKLEEYLKELVELPDEEAKVQVGTFSINLCDLLYEGNAFDSLPFIGIVKGTLLEDRNIEEKVFKLALRMKLNGSVQKEDGMSSLEYHLKQIADPNEISKKRVKAFFLYTFMLVDLDNEKFNPIENWKKIKELIDKDGFDEVTKKFVIKHNNANSKIYTSVEEMKELFTALIKYKTSSLHHRDSVYTRNLILYRGILDADIEGVNLLKPCKQLKEYLKYVSIVESQGPSAYTLLNIPIHITIQSKSLYEKGGNENTNLTYRLEDLRVLPIVMYPGNPAVKQDSRFIKVWEQMKSVYHIRMPYTLSSKNIQGQEGLLYTVIYLTTSYLLLDNIFKEIDGIDSKQLYIPIVRLHTVQQQKKAANLGEYIRDISKTLEHLLGITYRSTSQGFEIDKEINLAQWAYKNGVSSMFCRVPKQFSKKESYKIDKAAIIVVTSRKTDNTQLSEEQIMLLMGEVILFDKDKKGSMNCDSWKTFSDYYGGEDLYQKPQVLNDIVNELYQMGYHKIIYIAKAPYSSKLNITSQMKSMYFMDEGIIEMMKENKKDLMVYPLYFEQFSAVDYKDSGRINEALYVSNTSEIDRYLTNNSQSIAGVLNLYSGKSVGATDKKEGKYYRSVMLYSTLCNIYEDKQMNAALYEGLVSETNIKAGLVETLIMLHYARYEANKVISIKINPYERIIGDDSVSARSVQAFEFDYFTLRFNMLAYLTDVKKIIDKE